MQTKFDIDKDIQKKMIEILKLKDVHALALFGLVRVEGKIEPMFVIADTMPNSEEFQKELYALCDKYIDFRKVRDEQHMEQNEAS